MTTASTPAPATREASVRAWAGSVAGGLLLGVLTNLAQGWLPGAWNQIANSGAVWTVAAFVAGALVTGRVTLAVRAVAGLLAELAVVVGYYGYAEFGRHGIGSLYAPLIWTVMALVAGPLFGIAGTWWRREPDVRRRIAGLAALAGVFGQEGLRYAWVLHYAAQAWACLGCVVVLSLALARTHRERPLTLLAAVPFSLVAYVIIDLGFLNHTVG
ncbi:DUF6518 family protein [Streptomyces sp. SL13]|uniref:DUF6518 family protein n=1 Tax=Streptantibioticus silvisoli TaxID=2705255 RepID=A0AA90K9L9_9ACTN|nr:DUF6518 family protein [Streptantibioticus silvisoli]MDI5961221.1 DUF6518 family protein [Streptantibioticus silvisoli]MDI5971022.1 DUF6518 family protein [Streptantibioticus silvisoli]